MVSVVDANVRLASIGSNTEQPIKMWGFTSKGMTRMVSAAFVINTIVPLIFATFIFSACAVPDQSSAINTAGAICLATLSSASLLWLMKVASRYRLQQSLISGEVGMSITGFPIESDVPRKWIVDNLHAGIVGSQGINCAIACTAGGFIITEQCGIKLGEGSEAPTSMGYIVIAFHIAFLALAIRCGGSRKFM